MVHFPGGIGDLWWELLRRGQEETQEETIVISPVDEREVAGNNPDMGDFG